MTVSLALLKAEVSVSVCGRFWECKRSWRDQPWSAVSLSCGERISLEQQRANAMPKWSALISRSQPARCWRDQHWSVVSHQHWSVVSHREQTTIVRGKYLESLKKEIFTFSKLILGHLRAGSRNGIYKKLNTLIGSYCEKNSIMSFHQLRNTFTLCSNGETYKTFMETWVTELSFKFVKFIFRSWSAICEHAYLAV